MKLNNKGFAITTIIYGTLVIFLLLLASLLGMMSTHKLRIYKLKDKTKEIIEDKEVTCDVTVTPSGTSIDEKYYPTIELAIKASKSDVTYSFDGSIYNTTNTKELSGNLSVLQYNLFIKDKSDKEISCGTVKLTKRTEYRQIQYSDTELKKSSTTEYGKKPFTCKTACNSEIVSRLTFECEICSGLPGKTCNYYDDKNEYDNNSTCYTKTVRKQTCSPSGSVVKYGSWKSTSQSGDCYNSVGKRYTYKVET